MSSQLVCGLSQAGRGNFTLPRKLPGLTELPAILINGLVSKFSKIISKAYKPREKRTLFNISRLRAKQLICRFFYTTSVVKCKSGSGIILPRVRHGSDILEF